MWRVMEPQRGGRKTRVNNGKLWAKRNHCRRKSFAKKTPKSSPGSRPPGGRDRGSGAVSVRQDTDPHAARAPRGRCAVPSRASRWQRRPAGASHGAATSRRKGESGESPLFFLPG